MESSESMDTTAQPISQIPVTSRKNMDLKDFSLTSHELLPNVSDSILKTAFQMKKGLPSCKIHAESEFNKKKQQSNKSKPSLEIEMEMESGFEIVNDPDDEDDKNDKMESEDAVPRSYASVAASSAFVSAAIKESQKTYTENNAPTFSTSDDARLDFYFGVMDQTTPETTLNLLKKSWDNDSLDTLKLLANVRDIRKGKGLRPQYQQCLYWLYENHPETLYVNLGELVKFGYFKDILHLLTIIMFDGYMHPYFANDADPTASSKKKKGKSTKNQYNKIKRYQKLDKRVKGKLRAFDESQFLSSKAIRIAADAEKRIYNQKILDHYKIKQPLTQMKNKEMTEYRLAFAREKLQKDVKYRVFHLKVAELYAQQLVKDLEEFKNQQKTTKEQKKDDDDEKIEEMDADNDNNKNKQQQNEISLAAKWTPTLEGHFDRYTLIASTIAIKIAEIKHKDILTSGKSLPVMTYLARKIYNKEYCGPLRRYLEIPEKFMSSNEWDQVNYRRVSAKCMTRSKKLFLKHDKERFELYLSCKNNKVAGASMKPVEIICQVMSMSSSTDSVEQLVLEKQWESLVESIKKSGGLLKDAVSICDVSGSMEGVPMQAAIGLTLLTMSMTCEPWNSICVTFHERPELFHLDNTLSLVDKLIALRHMPWGGSTDLHAVFELIVSLGVKNKLKNDQMPKLLFIFTDMEFNEACAGTTMTNFEAAKKLFESHGFSLPTIVFWNLREDSKSRDGKGKSTPVQKNELGVALISGFAGQTLTYIMNAKDLSEMSPLTFMMDVINDERYKGLTVVD